MNNSTKFQVDVIIQRFSALKNDYIEIKSENKKLKETIDLLTDRLKNKEDQKLRLISLFKERIDQHDKKMESLNRNNNHLQTMAQEQNKTIEEHLNKINNLESTVQEQNRLIEEHLDTINRFKEEIHLLKEKRKDNVENNNTQRRTNKSHQLKNGTVNHFSHPSFCLGPKELKIDKKKSRLVSQSRWPNLNITVNGVCTKVGSTEVVSNNTTGVTKKVDKLPVHEKRRKLYCPDDGTIDLSSENEN